MYKVADFFCGGGGFSEGFHLAGFEIVFAVDKWGPAVLTHHMNHPTSNSRVGDVIAISNLSDEEFHTLVPDTEVIIGSPPCTFFSNSNKSGKADKTLGIELIKAYLRIVARKKFKENSKLRYWVLENVPNVEKYIKASYSAKELGLDGDFTLKVKHDSSRVYNAKMFGVASKRLRYLCGDFPEPKETILDKRHAKTVDMIQADIGEPLKELEMKIVDPNYGFEMPSRVVSDHHYIKEIAEFEWKKAKRLKEDRGYMGKMSFPEDTSKPSRTVMATMSHATREALIYENGKQRYRSPTVREVASIMSFPIDYRFYGKSKSMKYKLVGNAVPPKFSYALAKAICKENNLPVRRKCKPRTFDESQHFVELNFHKFDLNKEKPKKLNAKFKYHIPYLKIDAYRVELTNYWSDFDAKEYKWDVEIHHSQGKNAKIFVPKLEHEIFAQDILTKAYQFIDDLTDSLVDFYEFQRIHCMTENERIEKGLIGPYELLALVKKFIQESMANEDYEEKVKIKDAPGTLPKPIVMGYFVLNRILNIMKTKLTL